MSVLESSSPVYIGMELGDLFSAELAPELMTVGGVQLRAVAAGAGQVDSAMPLSIWPAALALSAHLLHCDFRSLHTIEVGAGTGFLSLSLLKAGVLSQATITDGEERAVELIRGNLELSPEVQAEAVLLDWNHCPEACKAQYDLVLGSDVMYALLRYSSEAVEPLFNVISALLNARGTALIANQKHRLWRFQDRIRTLSTQFGLKTTTEELDSEVTLLRLARN